MVTLQEDTSLTRHLRVRGAEGYTGRTVVGLAILIDRTAVRDGHTVEVGDVVTLRGRITLEADGRYFVPPVSLLIIFEKSHDEVTWAEIARASTIRHGTTRKFPGVDLVPAYPFAEIDYTIAEEDAGRTLYLRARYPGGDELVDPEGEIIVLRPAASPASSISRLGERLDLW